MTLALLRLESGDRQKASRTTIGPWPHECGQGRHLNLHVSRDVDIYIYMQAWICWLQSRQHSIACTLLGREKKKKKKREKQALSCFPPFVPPRLAASNTRRGDTQLRAGEEYHRIAAFRRRSLDSISIPIYHGNSTNAQENEEGPVWTPSALQLAMECQVHTERQAGEYVDDDSSPVQRREKTSPAPLLFKYVCIYKPSSFFFFIDRPHRHSCPVVIVCVRERGTEQDDCVCVRASINSAIRCYGTSALVSCWCLTRDLYI